MAVRRLDTTLVERGLLPTRSLARRLILAGKVELLVQGRWLTATKPGQSCPADATVRIGDDGDLRYVSRGGLKLAAALAHTGMDVAGATVLDVGQSTGGFSDCLLQAGAARVIGVDSGHGQLAARLRDDPRVVCLEGVNARRLPAVIEPGLLPAGGFTRVVMDVSFISQTLIVPGLLPLLAPGAQLLALVKPQFEVGRDNIARGGLVRDPALHALTRSRICAHYREQGLSVLDYFDSCIAGGDGNREFFIFAQAPC